MRGRKLKVFDEGTQQYREFSLSELSKLQVRVTRRRTEREWQFKEEGSAEKIFSGRTYPRLDFVLILTLKNKKSLKCNVAKGTPIYLKDAKGKRKRFLIQPHLKGEIGQTYKDLVYVREILLDAPQEAAPTKKKATGAASEKLDKKPGVRPPAKATGQPQEKPPQGHSGKEDEPAQQTKPQ